MKVYDFNYTDEELIQFWNNLLSDKIHNIINDNYVVYITQSNGRVEYFKIDKK